MVAMACLIPGTSDLLDTRDLIPGTSDLLDTRDF